MPQEPTNSDEHGRLRQISPATQYIIGHRGAAGIAPENTLLAFRIGFDRGDAVECDIHLSKDGKIVVIHDDSVDRTTDGRGRVSDLSLTQIRDLDAGERQQVPTLQEVVDLAVRYSKPLIVEIKGEDPGHAIATSEKLMEYLRSHPSKLLIVHSLSPDSVRLVKARCPWQRTAVITDEALSPSAVIELVRSVNADGASVAHTSASPALARLAHQRGISLDAWVLNDDASFHRVADAGVNGLITDYPGNFELTNPSVT